MTSESFYSPTLIAAASVTNKTVNQDSFETVSNPGAGIFGVAVADGVGSHFGAEIASRTATLAVREAVEDLPSCTELDMYRLYARAGGRVQEKAQRFFDDESNSRAFGSESFGTTLITLFETAEDYRLAYVGNGSIYHIRGNYTECSHKGLPPWCMLNYLNPHSRQINGSEVLYKAIVGSAPDLPQPSVLRIDKETGAGGDIFMVCTDGIYSYDQAEMGVDSKGEIWINGDQKIRRFLDRLTAFFADAESTAPALQNHLDLYLEELRALKLVSDDCTIGVLISPAALYYQRTIRTNRENGEHS